MSNFSFPWFILFPYFFLKQWKFDNETKVNKRKKGDLLNFTLVFFNEKFFKWNGENKYPLTGTKVLDRRRVKRRSKCFK